jgi:hypothetical protein
VCIASDVGNLYVFSGGRRRCRWGLVANQSAVPENTRSKRGFKWQKHAKIIVPPHGQHAKELGACSREENGAGNHGIFFHQSGQSLQAVGLVGDSIFDGFEIVSSDSDRNSGNNYKSMFMGQRKTERRAWKKNKHDWPISTINRNPMKMRYDMAKKVLLRCTAKRRSNEMAGNIGEARIKARYIREGVVTSAASKDAWEERDDAEN